MKKFLTMMLVTALVAGATSAVAATEETKNNDSAADSILSQVQANKAANKEKAGEQKEAAAPKYICASIVRCRLSTQSCPRCR